MKRIAILGVFVLAGAYGVWRSALLSATKTAQSSGTSSAASVAPVVTAPASVAAAAAPAAPPANAAVPLAAGAQPEAPAAPVPATTAAGATPLDDVRAELAKASDEEIEHRLKEVHKELTGSRLIERANQNALTQAERARLLELLTEESALKLTRLERHVQAVESEVL